MMLDRDRGLLKTACPRAGGQRGEPVEVDHHRRVVVDLGRLGGLRRLEPARLSIEPGDDGGAGVSHVATDDETVLGQQRRAGHLRQRVDAVAEQRRDVTLVRPGQRIPVDVHGLAVVLRSPQLVVGAFGHAEAMGLRDGPRPAGDAPAGQMQLRRRQTE